MSSAQAAKRAQKRKAKKEEADSQASATHVEAVAANMSLANISPAAAAVIQSASASTQPLASAASGTDPRIALKERGNKAYGERLMGEAIRCFTAAIETPAPAGEPETTPPFLASVYSNRSAAFAACYEWTKAITDADMVIHLAPSWSKGYYRKGQALEGIMHFSEAKESYTKGLSCDPNDAMLQRQLETIKSVLEEMNSVSAEQAAVNPEEDKFETMIQWLLKGKCRFPSLYLKYYSEDYRGVHSLTRIGKDEIVLEIPLSHIMTSEVAKASDIGQKLLKSDVDLNSTHSYLASYLLQEKHNPNSFWKPYLECLPQMYRNMPIFFTQEELSYLKGSFSLGKIADRHSELKEEYDNIVKFVPEYAKYSLDEFVWARSVVITRIFGLMINGNKTDGLVPMADMLNHKRPRETSWTYDDSRGAFTITSLRAMLRGEQIYDSYGRKCNSRFFVNYGFSLEENEDNTAVMWLTLPTADPQYPLKVRLLHSSKMIIQPNQPRRYQIPMDYTEDVTKECFAFLRFVHAQDSELLLLSSDSKFDVKKIEPISLRNEIEVLTDLKFAAEISLQQFETTLEEDNAILKDPNAKLTSNIRNAILMRRGEKEVLEYYIGLIDEVKPLLDLPWKEFKRITTKNYAGNKGKYDHYITTVIVPLFKNNH